MTAFIVGLSVLSVGGAVAYLRVRNAQRMREERRQEAIREARMRMAEQRMADNGGHALSARYDTTRNRGSEL